MCDYETALGYIAKCERAFVNFSSARGCKPRKTNVELVIKYGVHIQKLLVHHSSVSLYGNVFQNKNIAYGYRGNASGSYGSRQ